ncbi:MAG TPA: hypothetical protein VLC10_03930 [Patescibacteria group bacterium]|nr:hypothetical protein [Patescibacteria group bacterium]
MANSLAPVTTNVIYFGRTLLEFLKNQLVLVGRCMTSYEGAATAPGTTIQVPYISIPAAAATRAIAGQAAATAINAFTANVTMQQIFQAVTVDNLERLFSSVSLMEEAAKQMAYNVAAKADSMVAELAYRIGNATGDTDGTIAFDDSNKFTHLNNARKILMQNKSPMDDLTLALTPSEAAGWRAISTLGQVNTAGSDALLRQGSLGRAFGFEVMETQQIVTGYVGTTSSITASPAAVTNASGYPVGTTTMNINSVGTGDIPKGATFTVASSGAIQKYSVTTAATIGGNAATISFWPPLTTAAIDTDVVTFDEYTGTSRSLNLAFNRNAILCVARPTLPFSSSSVGSYVVTDEQTGLSVRIAVEGNIIGNPGYTETIAADIVFGCEVVRPQSAVKIMGLN